MELGKGGREGGREYSRVYVRFLLGQSCAACSGRCLPTCGVCMSSTLVEIMREREGEGEGEGEGERERAK